MTTIRMRVRTLFMSSPSRFPFAGFFANTFQIVPMAFELLAAVGRHRDGRLRNLSIKRLRDRDQPSLFQLRKMCREISFAEGGQALQEEEIGALAGRQSGQNRKARRLVNQAVEASQLFEWCFAHLSSSAGGGKMSEAPFEQLAGLDRLIHEPARLSILTALSGCKSADFLFLQRLTALSTGNLSARLSKLEEGGLVAIAKSFEAKIKKTNIVMTSDGRNQLERHWNDLERSRKQAGKLKPLR